MNRLRFLLLTHFEPHFEYFSDLPEAEEFEQYATRNLISLSRFFEDFLVEWTIWKYSDFDAKQSDEMLHFNAVFIGGSPWNVDDNREWMQIQSQLFSDFLHHQTYPPVFGICYGHQFLAQFFGGKVDYLTESIKKNITFEWNGKKIISWANHRQYVSEIPKHATVHVWADVAKTIPYVIQFDGRIWGIQAHVELEIGDETSESFWKEFFRNKVLGHAIGDVLISNISLNVEYFPYVQMEYIYDMNGEYLAIRGECVELVRQYLYKKTGINFASYWTEGNADKWFENAEKMNLMRISEEHALQTGDILCFSGGLNRFGHVALVENVAPNGVFISQQNVFQDERDLRYFLPFGQFDFQGFVYQGGLRIQS